MNFDDYEISPYEIQKLNEGLRSENWKNYYSVITIGSLSDITKEKPFFTNRNPHAELDLPFYDDWDYCFLKEEPYNDDPKYHKEGL